MTPTRPKITFGTEIQWVKLDELKPHPKNPRVDLREYAEKFETLKQSVLGGLFEPIKISKQTGYCLAGNQRLKVFHDLAYDEVPVQYNDCPTEKDEIEIMVKDNNELGAYDYAQLDLLLREFNLDRLEVMLNDMDMKQLDRIAKENKKKLTEDDVPSVPAVPKAQPGDIYQLGEHRLMCGDSTNLDDVDRLMDGMKADLVFTDPPYNVNYSGRGKNTTNTIKNDSMSREDFRTFLRKVFVAYRSAVKKSAPFYVCHSSSSQRDFEDAMEESGLKVRNQIIWNKTIASMGWGDYRWKHEPMFYAVFEGENTQFYGDRSQYTVWDETWDDQKILHHLKKNSEKLEKGGSTIWTLSRDGNYVHPTQKPIELIEIALGNSSKSEDIVLDLFGGSGSTLIGAEKSGRRAFLMELDGRYVDVILKRYEEYTGEKPIKIS